MGAGRTGAAMAQKAAKSLRHWLRTEAELGCSQNMCARACRVYCILLVQVSSMRPSGSGGEQPIPQTEVLDRAASIKVGVMESVAVAAECGS